MRETALILVLACSACGAGFALLKALRTGALHPLDWVALALPLGLGAIALAIFAVFELGLGSKVSIALVILAPAAGGLFAAPRIIERLKPVQPIGESLVPLCFGGIVLAATYLVSLAPATDGDALCYHLQAPKVFLAGGSLSFDPDLHETVYPLLTEMLYSAGLALAEPSACRGVQWLLGVSLFLSTCALARPFLGARSAWAGAIVLCVPAVSTGMSAPLNDIALAAFGNASILAWRLFRDDPKMSRALLTGTLTGFAAGVKYPALILAVVIGVAVLSQWRGRMSLARFAGYAAAFALAGSAWYVRAYHYTGNPVYPFFRSTFGGAGLDVVLDPIKRPLPVNAWNLASALVPMTLDPGRFDSFSHQWGPVFLCLLPVLFVVKPPKRLVELVGLGFVFCTICLTVRQSTRFVLISAGPFSAGAAYALVRLKERRDRVVPALIAGVLVFESLWAASRSVRIAPVVLGLESSDSYLARNEPTYTVGSWVAKNLPDGARIIGQDHRGFYIPRPYTMELAHRRRTGLGAHEESAEDIVRRLRDEGFTHVLFCPPDPIDAVEFDPTLSSRLEHWRRSRSPLFARRLTDGDGTARNFEIFSLDDQEGGSRVVER